MGYPNTQPTNNQLHTAPPSFHIMVKPRGAICNLGCQYCFYLKKEKLYQESSFRMPPEVLESYIQQYIESQRVPEVNFAWQGGEPTLMGLDFFRQAVALQKKYARPGMRILNSFQTNGILLDDAWGEFFHQNQFLVGLSMDGPAEVHDAFRRDKAGKPTHALVMRSAEVLKKHRVEFNILCCLHSASVGKAVDIYRFFRDEVETEFIQFIPIIERDNESGFQEGNRLTSRSIKPDQFGSFMIDVFDEWVRNDVGRLYVQLFDTSLAAWAGYRPGLCIFEPTCGTGMAMEHNGDLYSCDHFVEPGCYLGNIMETPMIDLVSSLQQFRFGRAKLDSLPSYCKKCDVRFICNGECPKNRILSTPQGEAGLNYLCEGYKAFFHHVDQPMKIMAALLRQGRPPAEIMAIMKEERSITGQKAASRVRHKKK